MKNTIQELGTRRFLLVIYMILYQNLIGWESWFQPVPARTGG